ncbi:LOW QUALITY PROTEIN: liprin-beta-1-like [Ptychodera flava]|uniref:LOW QUALITY PROTEIN: liprin-beta-1-like n=1 Tax=Ptychodera flava TaxID=63121 RepID=UPI00396A8D40
MSSSGNEASEMLAAALEQMDDIIAGTKVEYQNGILDSEKSISPEENSVQILKLLEDLREAIELAEEMLDSASTRNQVPEATSNYIVKWLQSGHLLPWRYPELLSPLTNGHSCECNHDNYEEKIQSMEGDKESLLLQISVLTEQVKGQASSVQELQKELEDTQENLGKTEEMLQQVITSKAALESEKMELMAELSDLKIKLASTEKEPDERLKESMNELADTKVQLKEREEDIEKLQREIALMKKVKEASASLEKDSESSRLKEAVESLMAANSEKDLKIEDLRKSLSRYKRVHEMVILAQGKKENGLTEGDQSDTASTDSSQPSSAVEDFAKDREGSESSIKVLMPSPTATSTPVTTQGSHATQRQIQMQDIASPITGDSQGNDTVIHMAQATLEETITTTKTTTAVITMATGEETKKTVTIQSPTQKSSSLEELRDIPDAPKSQPYPDYSTLPNSAKKPTDTAQEEQNNVEQQSPPENLHQNGFEWLPRMQEPQQPDAKPRQPEDNHFSNRGKTGASFGKGLFKFKGGGKRSSSAPNLAETEVAGMEEEKAQAGLQRYGAFTTLDKAHYPGSPKEQKKKKSGIKRFFGRLRRSSSGSWNPESEPEDDEDYNAFRRGGRLRATAGARLGWSRDFKNDDIDVPFAKWDSETVAAWLHEMGLGNYVSACRHCVKNGATLIKATPQFLEKELGIKHFLHRKKLQLAIRAIASEEPDKMGELDYNWVTRWLDDVGLPQYKDAFNEARIDGRMLHYLTTDDLFYLKVTNALHHVSIKRGIQCLRIQNFHPNCLKRRPTDESWQNGAEVMLWTNHRVMEWLRSVDLSEYAPNLRGSGVHGAFMVLDMNFTAETLASLLMIPPNKTLLRRHLTTHYVALVGADCQAKKREAEQNPNTIPLSQLAKMKAKKKNTGIRKKKSGIEMDDYVCPMNIEMPTVPKSRQGPRNQHTNGTITSSYRQEVRSADMVHRQGDEDLEHDPEMEQPNDEMDEGAVRQIGAFSEDMNKLTNMLAEEEFNDGITSNV